MQGTMIWFNVDKGHGFIDTEQGERLYVASDGFVPGELPKPRCKGHVVRFDREADGEEARAVNVSFVTTADPRRARIRSARGGHKL
jgi:cold shock CspA family protein